MTTPTTTARDPQILALAAHLEVEPDTISECRYGINLYECTEAPGEYLVLTDGERDTAASEALDSYIDDCLEIPAAIEHYFDRDAWKRDALMSDGYGHALSSYDGEEHETQIDGEWYYIYRVN
jgi:hypothetical protein